MMDAVAPWVLTTHHVGRVYPLANCHLDGAGSLGEAVRIEAEIVAHDWQPGGDDLRTFEQRVEYVVDMALHFLRLEQTYTDPCWNRWTLRRSA